MSYDWGPRYIVPSPALKSYSGTVQLREDFDEELLDKELAEMGLSGVITKTVNPWYYRRKNTDTWIKVGESADKPGNFAVTWNTRNLEDGQYEVLGLMHIFVRSGDVETAIARQNIVEVTVKN
ncbi:MAG: hypothetical protein KAI14_03115 [Dehalococcoidales bacterium]|nr:hypothetical protein [Dehalococcoidales bacterium]